MGNSSTIDYSPLLTNNPLITNAVTKIGWVTKKGVTRKNWNKRYALLLKSNILLYFVDSNCTEHRGTADFSQLKNVHIGTMKQNPSKFKVITEQRIWEFEALDREDAIDWVHNIRHNQNHGAKKNNHLDVKNNNASTLEYEMKRIKSGLMGWLTKRGELRHTWNRRWCILVPSRLLIYFSDETCQNFKGCADFTGNDNVLLFDDKRTNYFCVQTKARMWEFSCKNSHQLKHWSLSMQFLQDMDRKALILKPVDINAKYPAKELLRKHFQTNGSIKDIMWLAPDKIYVLIFDDESAVDYYMTQTRMHHISYPANNTSRDKESPSHDSYDSHLSSSSSHSSSETSIGSKRELIERIEYKVVAFTFSEYMGNVYKTLHQFDEEQLQIMVKKLHKSKKVSRRFSTKIVKTSNSNQKTRQKAKSLVSFTDKYNRSAMAELRRMHSMPANKHTKHAKHSTSNDSSDAKQDFDSSSDEETQDEESSSSTDDIIPCAIRMTSVTPRGRQIYSHPNDFKTYRNSSIFKFTPLHSPTSSHSTCTDLAAANINSKAVTRTQKLDDSHAVSVSYAPVLRQSHTDLMSPDEQAATNEYDDDDDDFEVIECPIIIDNGSGFIKAGFEISVEPILIANKCIRTQDGAYIAYNEIKEDRFSYSKEIDVICPMKRDAICDWDAMSAIWRYAVQDKVGADEMNEYPIMMTEAPGVEGEIREKQLAHFMETYNLHKFYMMNSALANFYNTGKTAEDHCVIVDVGHYTTNISCIYNGMYLKQYGATIERGGYDITRYLSRAISNASVFVDLDIEFETFDKIKKEYCYVSSDALENQVVNKTYILPDGRSIEIEAEQYEAPEILFYGSDAMRSYNKYNKKSLHAVLMQCINQIDDDDVERSMYKNIYCCGGCVKLPNFRERLQSELTAGLSRKMSIVSLQDIEKGLTVKSMNEGSLSAWFGCAVILSMADFEDKWITNEDYDEYGANILFHKCTHQYL